MTGDRQNIEWLVAEVLRRLRLLADAPEEPPRDAENPPATDLPEGDLVINARVVTLREIEGRLPNVRRVLVGQRAVVTPSVKDELRKKHIRLEHQAAAPAGQAPAAELTVARCTHTVEAAREVSKLTYPPGASVIAFDDLKSAAQTLATCVADTKKIALLLTDDPLSAICLANRFPSVRAARVQNSEEVAASVSAICANVIVVDPRQPASDWPEMLAAFRRGLPRHCPPQLRGPAK